MTAVPTSPAAGPSADAPLARTPLHALHVELGARMVPFAGYDMPVQYPAGILAEHRHARSSAALFDVSHMGQMSVRPAPGAAPDAVGRALEALLPQDLLGLKPGQQRYGLLLNESGGILDDLMVTRRADDMLLIVNAANKAADLALLQRSLAADVQLVNHPDDALLALQGPGAVSALARLNPAVATLVFMTGGMFDLEGVPCHITRSGYTGEDGFEISMPAAAAEKLARRLLAEPEVQPAGLGARDTLRLEAGLCLHGHDIDATTTPVEAGLSWAIQKVRREGGERAFGHPGAEVLRRQWAEGPKRRRVGFVGRERAPVREGTALRHGEGDAEGRVTSGTIGPSVNQVIAMGYVDAAHAAVGTEWQADVRGRAVPLVIAPMPFAPHRYHRA